MPFRPVSVPFLQGARQDLSGYQTQDSSALRRAENVIFLKRGSLRGRPSIVSRDAAVQVAGGGTALSANLAAVSKGSVAGIVPVQVADSSTATEAPLILYQGFAALLSEAATGGTWRQVGKPVMTRSTRSPALTTNRVVGISRANPVPCGTHVTGVVTTQGSSTGFPYVNDQAQVKYLATGTLANVDAASKANIAAAGDALFYATTGGDIRVVVPGALPVTTDVSIRGGSANVRTDTTPRQNIAAVVATEGGVTVYYVAYVSTTAGRITLKRVTAAGAISDSADVNGLGTVWGVALAYRSTGPKLGIMWIDTATATAKTKIYSWSSGTGFTDDGFNVNFAATTEGTTEFMGLAAGQTASDSMSCMFVTNVGSCFIGGRNWTAATQTSSFTLIGRYVGLGEGIYWEPLFGATVWSGRTVVGIARAADFTRSGGVNALLHRSQWVVLDVTELYSSANTTARRVIAYGQAGGCDRIPVSSASLTGQGDLAFAVHEGATFDADQGVTQSRAVRIHLRMSPVAGAAAQGLTYLSSNGHLAYDGAQLRAQCFVESTAYIQADTAAVGGGALPAGSYSYQATWEALNARGQVIRSGASNVKTITAALNDKVNVVVSLPQLWEYTTEANRVRVRLWATGTSPSAGAPLYYVTESLLTAVAATADVTLTHSASVTPTAEQLYTVGNVLDDEPAPGGDRGVALAGERLWVADQRRVYASKLLRPNVAPAWNTEGLHTLEIPSALGEIQGLAGYQDRLVVVCSDGCAVVRGPGVDDFGNGPGWGVDTLTAPGASVITPRQVVATPDGAVYQGKGGALWLLTPDGDAQRFSGPLSNEVVTGDVTFCPAGPTNLPGDFPVVENTRRLFHGGFNSEPVRHFDIDMGAWSLWNNDADAFLTHHCSINGELWGLLDDNQPVSFTGTTGVDALGVGDVISVIETGNVQVASTPGGWGRLRKARIVGPLPNGTVNVTMNGTADGVSVIITGVVAWGSAGDSLWPRQDQPEFWSTVQRCSQVRFLIYLSPSTFAEVTSLELEVWGGDELAPAVNRG